MSSGIYLLEVSVLWGLFYAIYHLVLRKETFFTLNRAYLLGTLLAGLVLPLVQLPGNIAEEVYLGVVYREMVAEVGQLPVVESSSFLPTSVWEWVYWSGVVVMIGRLMIGVVQIIRIISRSKLEKKGGYYLVRTPFAHTPFSFFRFLFLSEQNGLAEDARAPIVSHELAHIRGGHSTDVIIVEGILCAFWFHPLVYLFRRSIRDTHEYLADAEVLQSVPKARYGQLLLEHTLAGPALANHFNPSQFKNRLRMMIQIQSNPIARVKYLLVVPVFVFSLLVFNGQSVFGQERQSDPVFTEVDEMPRFPGCDASLSGKALEECSVNEMFQFIFKNIKYPSEARKNNVEGMVVLSFVVGKDGTLSNKTVKKSVGSGCDEAALAVLGAMPKWVPGKQDGKAVKVKMVLPIKFALTNEAKEDKGK